MHNHYGTLFSVRHDKTSIYSLQIGYGQTKNRTPAKSTWWSNESYWGCLQEYGWGVIYRSRNDENTASSQKLNLSMVAGLQTVEAWTTHQTMRTVQYGNESLPGISVKLTFFWVALVFDTSRWLNLSESSHGILASLRVIQKFLYCLCIQGEGEAWYT